MYRGLLRNFVIDYVVIEDWHYGVCWFFRFYAFSVLLVEAIGTDVTFIILPFKAVYHHTEAVF